MHHSYKVVKIMLLLFIVTIGTLPLGSSADSWPMFHYNPAHTGASTSQAPNLNNLVWSYTTEGTVESSPAVAYGNVYIGSEDGYLYCLDAETGNEVWNVSVCPASTLWLASPAVMNNYVYMSGGSNIVCLNAENGSLIWSYSQGGSFITSSPIVVNDKVYIGVWGGIYCFDANPQDDGIDEGVADPGYPFTYDLIWTYDDDIIVSSPAFSEGKIYVTSQDNNIYCLNATSGLEQWNHTTGGLYESSPVVYDDKVYVGSLDKNLYCFHATNGTEVWSYNTGHAISSSPAAANGKIYVGVDKRLVYEGGIYCLDAENGDLLWTFDTDEHVRSSPALADDKVYFGSYDKKIYCLNANDGSKIGEYDTGSRIGYSSPAISEGKLFIGAGNNVYCFEDSQPPETPTQPSGPSSGTANEDYSFTTSTTDPDGDQVYYMWDWGDGTFSDWLGPYISGQTIETEHAWTDEGNFDVKVKAKDVYGSESDWSETLAVTITSPFPALHINCQSSVIESDDFEVSITSDGESIENANVIFNGKTRITNESGQVTFSSPPVDDDTDYLITASKEEYQSDSLTITVLNIEEEEPKGWIYGIVYDSSGLIENAKIIITSGDKSWIVYTDNEGRYVKSLPIGTYSIQVSKNGYETITRSEIIVKENTAYGNDFELKESSTSVEKGGGVAKYIVESQIEEGDVGAEIDATSTEHHVTLYSDLDIDVSNSNSLSEGDISFSVTGEGPGTIIVIYVTGVENEKNIFLTYDGTDIGITTDISGFFSSENTEESWIMLSIGEKGEYVILLNVPHFSEHTITISAIFEGFTTFSGLILYSIIGVIAVAIFFGPGLKEVIHRKNRLKKIKR